MLEGSNHHYEPIQMPALSGKTRGFPLRGGVSPVPRTAHAQPGRGPGAEANAGEANLLARTGLSGLHAIRGKLKGNSHSVPKVP